MGKAGWTRRHGDIIAFVMQHGPDDFSAVATRWGDIRATQQHITTLATAQASADSQAPSLWPHSCQATQCGAWDGPTEYDD